MSKCKCSDPAVPKKIAVIGMIKKCEKYSISDCSQVVIPKPGSFIEYHSVISKKDPRDIEQTDANQIMDSLIKEHSVLERAVFFDSVYT